MPGWGAAGAVEVRSAAVLIDAVLLMVGAVAVAELLVAGGAGLMAGAAPLATVGWLPATGWADAVGVLRVAPLPFGVATCLLGPLFPDPVSAKKSRQIGSRLSGSARNCWYFSSTNQSLGPNSGTTDDDTVASACSALGVGYSRLNLTDASRLCGLRGVDDIHPISRFPGCRAITPE